MVDTVKRFLALTCESLPGPGELVIELDQVAVAPVALELCLLNDGLSESLRLQPRFGPAVVLRVAPGGGVSKAVVARTLDGSVTFILERNQAEYIRAVLLRAYRDQMAEVNHVHVEGDLSGTPFDLTIMFAASREPMSPHEAEELMRD